MEECTSTGKGPRRVTGKTVQDVDCEGDGGGWRVRRDSANFLYIRSTSAQPRRLGEAMTPFR